MWRLAVCCLGGFAASASGLAGAEAPTPIPIPEEFPPHPRLLFTRGDLEAIRRRAAEQPGAKARFEALRKEAAAWVDKPVQLPDRGGQWYHYYACPRHGARLKNEGPTRHVCPVDKEVFAGYPYDDVYVAMQHDGNARALRTLGIVYQLAGDAKCAAKAKDLLLAYAEKYEGYKLHNIKGEPKVGGGKIGPQTLDESTWLIAALEGADGIWETLSEDERRTVARKLIYPATKVIRDHKMGIHNIQCWKNSAVGLAGLLLGDRALLEEAVNGPNGYVQQMAKGVSPDGVWFEGAWGYHFYTVSAVVRLTEGAFHSGLNLYGPGFKRMFDGPLQLAMPNLQLPAFHDSGTVSVTAQAGHYEAAYARYKDERYRAVLRSGRRDSDAALFCGMADVEGEARSAPPSANYPASGYAVLNAGTGPEAAWLCVDYGPHGGGHGHPDKLGFVLYAFGSVLAPDPGTTSYGVPLQANWYRTTIAHNTLGVNEESQQPAEGRTEAFLAKEGFSAFCGWAGKIYPGVDFYRTVALIGKDLFVFVDQVRSGEEKTFDLAYHQRGTFQAPGEAAAWTTPAKPGYSQLRDAKALTTSAGLELLSEPGKDQYARWVLAAGPETQVILGTGVGAHTEDRVPLVIARRKARETAYAWAVALGAKPPELKVAAEPVTLEGGGAAPAGEAYAVRVTREGAAVVLLANPGGKRVTVAGQALERRIALLAADGAGAFTVRHAAP
jgi:hypothetical protein